MTTNASRLIVLVTLVIIVIGVIVLGYLAFYDDNPSIEFLNEPFPILQSEVRAGDAVFMRVDQCRFTDAPVTIYRQWRGEIVYSSPAIEIGGSPAGCVVQDVRIVVPEFLPPGEYVVTNRLVYHVNPLAERVVDTVSQPFEVIGD